MLDKVTRRPRATLPSADLRGGQLWFSDVQALSDACRIGAFLVPIPATLDLATGLDLCREFYRPARGIDDPCRTLKARDFPISKLGYSDRGDQQMEQVQLEDFCWRRYLPASAANVFDSMRTVALTVLTGLFRLTDVPDHIANRLLYGDNGASQPWCGLSLNHYRSNLRGLMGVREHTDSGYLSLLYADQPGLQVEWDGAWRSIPHDPGSFVALVGNDFQRLTERRARPVMAAWHRVAEILPQQGSFERSAMTIVFAPAEGTPLYRFDGDGGIKAFGSYHEYYPRGPFKYPPFEESGRINHA